MQVSLPTSFFPLFLIRMFFVGSDVLARTSLIAWLGTVRGNWRGSACAPVGSLQQIRVSSHYLCSVQAGQSSWLSRGSLR